MNQITPAEFNHLASPPETPARRRLPLANPPRLVPARLPAGGILIGPVLLLAVWQAASMLAFPSYACRKCR